MEKKIRILRQIHTAAGICVIVLAAISPHLYLPGDISILLCGVFLLIQGRRRV